MKTVFAKSTDMSAFLLLGVFVSFQTMKFPHFYILSAMCMCIKYYLRIFVRVEHEATHAAIGIRKSSYFTKGPSIICVLCKYVLQTNAFVIL